MAKPDWTASDPAPRGVPILTTSTVTFDRLKAFIREAMTRLGLPEADAADGRHADGGSRSAGIGRPRRQPAAAICPPHQGRRLQRAAQHHGGARARLHRAAQRRQRHGPSRDEARGRNRDRKGAHDRDRLGQLAIQQPCGARLALRVDAAEARHDRAVFRGRQRQPSAALGRPRHAAVDQPDRGRNPGR